MAREPATNEVDGNKVCCAGFADVGDTSVCVGPVCGEDGAREIELLDLPDGAT